MTSSNGVIREFPEEEKKVVQKDSDEGGQKSVLACMNVCVKCKVAVTAALTDRCSQL